jgi:hypothetical protein
MKREYFYSYDVPRNGDYSRAERLCGHVAHVRRIVPKTSLLLERLPGQTFGDIKRAARRTLDRRRGRAVLISRTTRNVFKIDNRGNQPGIWVKV